MKWNLFASWNVVAGLACVFLMAGSACAEKSLWQKFKDFFNPGETVDCEEGPTCEEYRQIESKINTVEGKYSRERRPANKRRYKQELDSLTVIRDSLVAVIKGPEAVSSSAVVQPVSSEAVSESSSSAVPMSSSQEVSSSSETLMPASCKPDTVYVRDTVIVHDTLFVVVTNKPAEAPVSSASAK